MKLVRFGTGYAFRIPSQFGLTRLSGMMFKPSGLSGVARDGSRKQAVWSAALQAAADCGSLMNTGILLPGESLRVMQGLSGLSSSLNSPRRIFIVGTASNPLLPSVEPDSRK